MIRTSLKTSLKTLTRRILAVAAFGLAVSAAHPASAALFTYSTEGSFNGAPLAPISTVSDGGITLTFTGVPSTSVDANPASFIALGTFSATGVGTGDFSGDDFDLRVTQTTPAAGTATIDGDLSGTVTGSIGSGNSTLLVTLNDSTFVIDGVTYTIDDTTLQVPVPGQSVVITATAVIPEPAALGLLAVGLPLLLRRKRA